MSRFPNLAAEMERYSIGVKDAAEVVGRTEKTITNWMSGKSEPTITQAINLTNTFFPGQRVEYLFAAYPISSSIEEATTAKNPISSYDDKN